MSGSDVEKRLKDLERDVTYLMSIVEDKRYSLLDKEIMDYAD